MPTQLFAFNSLAGCGRTSTGIVESTTSGRFDSAYVPNAILVPTGTDYFEAPTTFFDGTTNKSTMCVRADFYANSGLNGGTVVAMHMPGAAGANGYRLVNPNSTGTMQMQYWNSGTSAWVNWGSSFAVTNQVLYKLHAKVVAQTSYEVKLGGVSVASSASAPSNAAAAIYAPRFHGQFGNVSMYWSQIMGADYDISDNQAQNAALAGNSAANTDGSGAYTDINETVLDDSTAALLAAAGKRGYTKSSVTVPGGLAIVGAVINARGRVAGGTITQGKHGWRSGGSNTSSTDRAYSSAYEPRGSIKATDPNTGIAWSQSGFNSAEIYLEAV